MTAKLEHVSLAGKVMSYIRDPQVALWRKLSGLAAAAYIISPIDLIPDFIPILGWLDDLGILSAFAWFMVREVRKHAKQQEEQLQQAGYTK